jgi:hypothetical protein
MLVASISESTDIVEYSHYDHPSERAIIRRSLARQVPKLCRSNGWSNGRPNALEDTLYDVNGYVTASNR